MSKPRVFKKDGVWQLECKEHGIYCHLVNWKWFDAMDLAAFHIKRNHRRDT